MKARLNKTPKQLNSGLVVSAHNCKNQATTRLVDNRNTTALQLQLIENIANSPQAVAQRQQLDQAFGNATQPVGDKELVQGKFETSQLKLKVGSDSDITDGGISPTTVDSVLPATFTRPEVKQVEGKSMEAKTLGPGAVDGGTATNDYTRPMARELSVRMGRRYVAGHLLNHHLGGSGVDRTNITAFSSKSNSQHLHYTEKHIKNAVKSGYWVYYKVDTTRNGATNIAETMTTTWGFLDEDLSVEGGLHKATFNLDPGDPTAEHTQGALNLFSSKKSLQWGIKYSQHVIKRLGLTGAKVHDACAIMLTGDYDDEGKLLNEDDIKEQLEDRDIGDYSVNGIIGMLKPESVT